MRQNASGITLASTSHTIVSLNNRRIFATRSSETSITSDIIPRRLKICSALFFDHHVELIMRAYIASRKGRYFRWLQSASEPEEPRLDRVQRLCCWQPSER